MASVSRFMRMSYFAPHPSHRIEPNEVSKLSLTAHDSDLPQKGQSKICATFGLAFLGGGLALFRLPLRASGERARQVQRVARQQGWQRSLT